MGERGAEPGDTLAARGERARTSTVRSRLPASRDLRAPLDSIVGMAAILLLEDLPPQQRDYVEKILHAARSALTAVDEALDVTKRESEPAPGELARDVTGSSAVTALGEGPEASCSVDPAPSAVVARDHAQSTARPPSTSEPVARRGHVLVAEDHPVTRELLVGMLQALGCTVELAVDGVSATSAYHAGKYDLVLMDLQMPRMDGYHAAAAIRRREGRAPRTPIIALTSQPMERDRARALASGMNDYLRKPIEVDALARVLERWMERRLRVAHTPPPTPRMGDAIDPSALEQLLREGNDLELVREVVTRFTRDLSVRLSELRDLVASGDDRAAATSAHALAARSGLLGANRFARLANELEAATSASERERAGSLLDLLQLEAGDVRAELERILRRSEPAVRSASGAGR